MSYSKLELQYSPVKKYQISQLFRDRLHWSHTEKNFPFLFFYFLCNYHKELKKLETKFLYCECTGCVELFLNSVTFSLVIQTTSLPGAKFSVCIPWEMLSLNQLSGTVAVITSDGRMIVVSIWHIHSLLSGRLIGCKFLCKTSNLWCLGTTVYLHCSFRIRLFISLISSCRSLFSLLLNVEWKLHTRLPGAGMSKSNRRCPQRVARLVCRNLPVFLYLSSSSIF